MYQGTLRAQAEERPVDPEQPTAAFPGERPVDHQIPTIVKTLATAAGPILELRLPSETIEQLKRDDGTLTVRLVPHE